MAEFTRPITIKIVYDKRLQKITKVASEDAVISDGLPFLYLLHNIFISHPAIFKLYPPGAIAMELNGQRPLESEKLKDNDMLKLWIPNSLSQRN